MNQKDNRDIDAILDSMFQSGRLNLNGSRKTEEQTEQALKALQEAQLKTAASLNQNIDQLTRDVQAQMESLQVHLEEDGVDKTTVPVGNSGSGEQIEAAFEKTKQELAQKVLGQEKFLADLIVALKRPFITGFSEEGPMEKGALLGNAGTGKHSALTTAIHSLGRQGVLKSPKAAWIDLSRYGEASGEKLFYQDLYAALKGGSAAIVFEEYEKCGPAVLSLVSQLFREGEIDLPSRYAEQKGMLVEIGSALVPGAVSSLSAAGKYLFLLSENDEENLINVFGAPFLAAMDDVCETQKLTGESLKKIAEQAIGDFCKRVEGKLGYRLAPTEEGISALAAYGSTPLGAEGISHHLDSLYRALGEHRLRGGVAFAQGELTASEGVLQVVAESGGEPVVIGEDRDSLSAQEQAKKVVRAELKEVVGLTTVKEYILSLEDNFAIQQLRRKKGMKADSPSMHMIFTGNPGTGKTTVARIVSRYLKAIGVLTGGQLVEVTRADLVGQYVGHTAPLTQKAIASALGGVLFIDEAYSLYRGRDDSFGLECIDTLVKGMEDNREDLVVILAGYSQEMKEFLTANSGLKSRFPNIIEFPDYTARELLDITRSIVKKKGYKLDVACEAPLLAYYEKEQSAGDPRTNGNGRMARNKVEEAVIACSSRSIREPEEKRNLELLLPVDFGFARTAE